MTDGSLTRDGAIFALAMQRPMSSPYEDAEPITGVVTALIMPQRDGAVDDAALARLVETQLAAGIGQLLVGSQAAGEGATLSFGEILHAARLCIDVSGSSAAVILDVSSNGTAKAAARAREAEAVGVDCLLVSSPWYNRPSQDGLARHFEAVAAACGLPMLIGNDASRCCVDIGGDTLVQIASLEAVVGLIEWSPDVSRISAARCCCPAGFSVLAADDLTGLGALAHGAHGLVSVTANVLPGAIAALHAAWTRNDVADARRWCDELRDLQGSLSQNPQAPVAKALLSHLAVCRPDVRLPITAPDADRTRAAVAALQRLAG